MKTNRPRFSASLGFAALLCLAAFSLQLRAAQHVLEDPVLRLVLDDQSGQCVVLDKRAGVTWGGEADPRVFGRAALLVEGKLEQVNLSQCQVRVTGTRLEAEFLPLPNASPFYLRVQIILRPGGRIDFSYEAQDPSRVQELQLLGGLLSVTDVESGYVCVPVREGLLVPANSRLGFSQRFDTYAYEGCHMAMVGIVRGGAAALVTWPDLYTALNLESRTNSTSKPSQILEPSFSLRKSSRSLSVEFLGRGDYVKIAKRYRSLARERGWLHTWDQKLAGHPQRAKLFGAINFKLWSTLDRRMNEDGTREESVRVNWTFDEAAQVAEHLKNDLKLDNVLFTLGGWIHRGYDNQHPDILPAAPECGGDTALADCARRVMGLGYLFCLHDNYQDIYRDAPSWDESYVMKTADGKLAGGGHWAGGVAYLTCAQRAVDLARRPKNLPAVREITRANAYFIDTTYAAGLQECFDTEHPLTRRDDLRWKQVLSEYTRDLFGVFGSECGREWAIPCSDFFEGLTGVSGTYYHDAKLPERLGAVPIPLFELVYRDCIAMYGKYGYDPSSAARYVLHHIMLGRPLNYHDIPPHLYWKNDQPEEAPLRPGIADLTHTGPRRFSIRYRWEVESSLKGDYRVFVHFTDPAGKILFQNDHSPERAMVQWSGVVREGPFEVSVPAGVEGTVSVRMGLFEPNSGRRVKLAGPDNDQRSYLVGNLKINGDKVTYEPLPAAPASAGDPALFTRAHNGWAAGLHPLDRFVKNTYEILSPLNQLTARMEMTSHEFLTPDRSVQKSQFGRDGSAATVWVNGSLQRFTCQSTVGGQVVLPPNGFLVEAPGFVAFHALAFNGREFAEPTLFTLTSLDDAPLQKAKRVRAFHLSGDSNLRLFDREWTVPAESILKQP